MPLNHRLPVWGAETNITGSPQCEWGSPPVIEPLMQVQRLNAHYLVMWQDGELDSRLLAAEVVRCLVQWSDLCSGMIRALCQITALETPPTCLTNQSVDQPPETPVDVPRGQAIALLQVLDVSIDVPCIAPLMTILHISKCSNRKSDENNTT